MADEVRSLREWRGRRMLTIRELAKRAEVSPGVVVRAEAGGRTQVITMTRLAQALEVEPRKVLEWSERFGRGARESETTARD